MFFSVQRNCMEIVFVFSWLSAWTELLALLAFTNAGQEHGAFCLSVSIACFWHSLLSF
jgi:hypothetical protein